MASPDCPPPITRVEVRRTPSPFCIRSFEVVESYLGAVFTSVGIMALFFCGRMPFLVVIIFLQISEGHPSDTSVVPRNFYIFQRNKRQ